MQHHVYFWLKPEHQNESGRATFEEALNGLLNIESVAGGKWGSPANTPERPVTDKSFDYGLYLTFDSLADHDTYQVDPLHDVFVDACKDLWSQVKVMDVT